MKCLFLAGILLSASNLWAQAFGGNPASIKWQQINTDKVKVIFAKGESVKAQRIAAVIEAIQKKDSSSLGDGSKKISLVLQSGKTISNAYVGLAPWRSEFYSTPPQDPFELGSINWIDNLSIHEYRHVQQYSNFNKGFSKFAAIILGEQGQALANAAAIPDWFFEGDAVYNETKFSIQGRGKLPLFFSGYQALFHAGKHYNYMQLRNGSYQHYVPNHYQLGYLLVSYGRQQYGDAIWQKITNDAARFKPFFYPFQNALKQHTGISFDAFVSNALRYYELQWKAATDTSAHWLTPLKSKDVVDYKYPYKLVGGDLLVLKKSLQKNPAFYRINSNRKELKIANRAIANEDYYSYNNGKIIYAAYQPDIRWANREFNQIKILDIETGEEKTVVRHSKYFSPDIAHNGAQIVTVELDSVAGSSLVLLDKEGNKISTFHHPEYIFASPKFSANDQNIYVTARNERGEMGLFKKGLAQADSLEAILPLLNRLIGYLAVQGDTLLFTTTYKGADEIGAYVDMPMHQGSYRLARFATGLYQGVMTSDGQLVASAFTADGYRLGDFKPLWKPHTFADTLTNLYTGNIYPSAGQQLISSLGTSNYAVKKYRATTRLLNIHSWRPLYDQPEYSFTLYGDNVLNTLHSELAYTYNQNEGSHKAGYAGVWGASYLQPVLGVNQTWDRTAYLNKDTAVHWNEANAYLGVQLPLNLSGGNAFRFLTLSSTYNIEQVRFTGIGQKLLRNGDYTSINSRLAYSSQVQKAPQQLFPVWAQTLVAQYKTQVNTHSAHQFLLSGSWYLPGLGKNHSVVLTGAFQSRDTLQQYNFTNNFPFSRGYTAIDFPSMWKMGANYHLPLCYPEWGFGNMVYLLRMRANLFYDYTQGKSLRTGTKYAFGTAGAELYFDTRWWNQQAVSFGVRYSYLMDKQFVGVTQAHVWEFILPVNLF